MAELLLIFIPLGAAALAAAWPDNRTRPWFLPLTGALHLALCVELFIFPPTESVTIWVGFDSLARAVLPVVSALYMACAVYGVSYLRIRSERSNRVFVPAFLAMLGLMSLAHQALHLGLLWISVEGVTLSTVPLVHFSATARAYEATWKYLLVGGTGLALSLLGSFALGYASLHGGGVGDLTFTALVAQGAALSRPWVLVAWVLVLIGYGTKMGLAPMHTWKPDAYGESPGIVGAMLAGGVTTVAFTAILRVRMVVDAAGETAVTSRTMLFLGLVSIVISALFMIVTRDFKRVLAYSSIEHMGIMSIGAGLGGAGLWVALFHLWNNAVTKGALFLAAGNLRRGGGGHSIDDVRGMSLLMPHSSMIFVVGLFAVTASPPFGPFFSELRMFEVAVSKGYGAVIIGFVLLCLLLGFAGVTRLAFLLVDGRPRLKARREVEGVAETWGVLLPPILLLMASITFGMFPPAMLLDAWSEAASDLESTGITQEVTSTELSRGLLAEYGITSAQHRVPVDPQVEMPIHPDRVPSP